MLKELVLGAALALGLVSAQAETFKLLDFDDLPPYGTWIPSTYKGFQLIGGAPYSWEGTVVEANSAPFTDSSTVGSGNVVIGRGIEVRSIYPFRLDNVEFGFTLGAARDRYIDCTFLDICPPISGTIEVVGKTESGDVYTASFGLGSYTWLTNGPSSPWPYLISVGIHLNINDAGEEYGGFLSMDNIALVSSVPLPAGALLFGTGLLGMLRTGRKKLAA